MHTDESWFLNFEHRTGRKESARLTTTNGGVIADLQAPEEYGPTSGGPGDVALTASFEDNVRIMAAGREMLVAMDPLLQAALEAGLPEDHPAVVNARAALALAKPEIRSVTLNGKHRFAGTDDECVRFILLSQGQSVDFATRHGGWAIGKWEPPAPSHPWKDKISGFVYRTVPSPHGVHEIARAKHRLMGVVPEADGSIDERKVWDVYQEAALDDDFDQRALEAFGLVDPEPEPEPEPTFAPRM